MVAGKYRMDKTQNQHLTVHSRDNQTLSVESFFVGTETIQEVIRQYISERWRAKREFGDAYLDASNSDTSSHGEDEYAD